MISESKYKELRASIDAFERAREQYDPKRYARGGGYEPHEYAQIARAAGLTKEPSNDQRAEVEVYEFVHQRPEKYFAYYDKGLTKVTNWTGIKLGDIIWKGYEYGGAFGGKRLNVRIRAINGLVYSGTCNMTGGTYCRMKAMKSSHRNPPVILPGPMVSPAIPGVVSAAKVLWNNPGQQQAWLAEQFVKGANSGVAGSMYIHGGTIYSYGPHFPVARREGGMIAITARRAPSKTTAGHIGLVKRAAQAAGLEVIFQELQPEASGPAGYTSNPRRKPVYLIEGNKRPFGSVGKRQLPGWRTFRSTSLEAAREYADKIFQATGIVVAITQEGSRANPLTRRESGEEVRQVRTSMQRAMDLQRAGLSPSYDIGYAHGVAGVVGRHGTKKAQEVAERAVRHIRYDNPASTPAALKRQMVAFLKKSFRGLVEVDSKDTEFDIEGAIYWFANDYHGGGSSDLYSILSTSPFSPGPSVRGPETEIEKMMYEALEQKYGRSNPRRRRSNPLTRREADRAFTMAFGSRVSADQQRKGSRLEAHYRGRAYGYADSVSEFGPRDMRQEAAIKRSEASVFKNPRGEGPSKLREVAQSVGLYVDTWAPGDGVTRYRFFKKPSDYFAGDGIYTALGLKEAWTFLRGCVACASRTQSNPRGSRSRFTHERVRTPARGRGVRYATIVSGGHRVVRVRRPGGQWQTQAVLHPKGERARVRKSACNNPTCANPAHGHPRRNPFLQTVTINPKSNNPYVVVDRTTGRVSSIERGRGYGAASRAHEWAAEVSADMGRPQDVRRVSRVTARVGDPFRRPRGRATVRRLAPVANPPSGRASIPWRNGQKIPIETAKRWVESLNDPELSREFEKAYRLQFKSNRKPRYVVWRTVAMGSPRRIDMVTCASHYGDSPETVYRPPRGSRKGHGKLYRHEWGEGGGSRSVPLLASASGKALIMPLHGRKIAGDWLRH